jgi:hypothetical protein
MRKRNACLFRHAKRWVLLCSQVVGRWQCSDSRADLRLPETAGLSLEEGTCLGQNFVWDS